MASVLALNNLAFLGTMEDITKYLGLVNNSNNAANINKALNALEKDGYISLFKDKKNIIIALSYDAKRFNRVVVIQKAWIEIIRGYKPAKKDSIAWETILRVFIFLLGNIGTTIKHS